MTVSEAARGDGSLPGAPDRASANEIVAVSAFVAAVAAAFTGVEPTGSGWWDSVLAAALGVAVVVAASRAHPFAVVGAATMGAMFTGLSPWLIVAIVGVALAMGAVARSAQSVPLQAAAGGFSYLALLHLVEFGFFGASALLAGAAILVVLGSAYLRLGHSSKARLRSVALAVGLAVFAYLIVVAYQAVALRSTADAGVRAARAGLASARAGDPQQLAAELDRAEQLLADADRRARSPLMRPLALLPVGAQHLRSLSTATAQGRIVTTEAATLAQDVDLEDLQLRQGQFDLDLLASMAPRLESAASSLETSVAEISRNRSPWLLPMVDRQIGSLLDEAAEAIPETRLAADAAAVMPQMLGADAERRYLMFFGSPGESREFGGFIGGYALLRVVDGGLDLLDAGSINELVEIANSTGSELDDPRGYPQIYEAANVAVFPQNLTSSPNLSVIARAVRDVFPELRGAPIDGVLYADPYALAAFTEFTGPLKIDGVEQPLDQAAVADFIFDGQYRAYESRDARFGALGALAAATAANFEGADLPGPERLGEVLGPAARAGRLQIITYDDRENEFLASVRLQRAFGAPEGIDSFAVVHSNGSESKLDLFLHRTVRYETTVDDSGGLTATVDVELRSDVPADAPALTFGQTDGTTQVLLSLYTPHELVELTVNGAAHPVVTHDEFGFQRHALSRVPVAPNEAATVRFTLRGEAPPGPYRVGVWSQPLVNRDLVEVVYNAPAGETFTASQELDESWLAEPGSP